MKDAQAACDWLCAPQAEVSAHYMIARTGEVWRLVDEDKRAWHAGAGRWGAIEDVNSHSIGIELDNDGASPFSAPLMGALELLLPQIMQRWGVAAEGVIGHSDMAPGRKIDPGPRFDWRRLARQGLAIWPEAADPAPTPDESRFAAALAAFGMTAPADPDIRLAAFRSRFRPGATGALAPQDMALAEDLAGRFCVDAGAASA
jgi:N-acetylmuramoyl-L-alanine amidase